MLDPHRVLGVSLRATLAEAEDAYHRLLRREHPDLHHDAGPDRIAQAEHRTREINAAISQIRDRETARTAAGRTTGAGGSDATSGSATGAGAETTGDGPDDPSGTAHGIWNDATGEWQTPPEPTPTAACPWCGQRFDRPSELKDHVFEGHELRVDRRVRGGLLGGRFHRWMRSASHLPLWGVVPINVVLATVIGILVALVTDELIGRWAFAIAMTPTIAALVDWAFDQSR